MKTQSKVALCSLILVLLASCSDREAELKTAKEEADAKARADAARKEMDTLRKTFKSRDVFKKNEPQNATPATPSTAPKSTTP